MPTVYCVVKYPINGQSGAIKTQSNVQGLERTRDPACARDQSGKSLSVLRNYTPVGVEGGGQAERDQLTSASLTPRALE